MAQIQSVNRDEAEVWYVHVQNIAANSQTEGDLTSYTLVVNASHGLAVSQPQTSSLNALAGVVPAGETIVGGALGRVICWGVAPVHISTDALFPVGTVLGALDGLAYAVSNGTSDVFGPIIIASEPSGALKSSVTCLVRCL